jgi:hypothetical protein
MKPRKTPVINSQGIAQAFEQQLVGVSFPIKLSPEAMVKHPVQVLAAI